MSDVRKRQTPDVLSPILKEVVRHVRTGNPMLDAAIRVLSSQGSAPPGVTGAIGSRREAEYEEGQGFSEADQKRFVKALLAMETGLFLIIGQKGTGKTALSARMLELYGERGKSMYAFGMGLLPSHIHELEDIDDLPNHSAVVLDDTNLIFNNRSYYSTAGQLLLKLITLSRQKDIIIIANTQQSAAVNRYLLQADALFMKPQSALVAGYERAQLMQVIKEADMAFAGMDMNEVRGQVYVVRTSMYLPDYRGMLSYLPPPWFSDKYSKGKARA